MAMYSKNSLIKSRVLSTFMCPVCFDYMHPPIRQCFLGHNMCSCCFQFVKVCPICNAPKSDACRISLENLHASVIFPCSNVGCNEVFRGAGVLEHEENCNAVWTTCPMNECMWKGPRSVFEAHCMRKHPRNYSSANNAVRSFLRSENEEYKSRTSLFVVKCIGNYFLLVWRAVRPMGLLKFNVFLIGNQGLAQSYKYHLEILDVNNSSVITHLESFCSPMIHGNYFMDDESTLILDETYFEEYYFHNNLYYRVRLEK